MSRVSSAFGARGVLLVTNGSRPRSTTTNRGNGKSNILGQTAKRLLAYILDFERQHKQTHLPSGSLPGKQVRKYLSAGSPHLETFKVHFRSYQRSEVSRMSGRAVALKLMLCGFAGDFKI